MRSLDGMAVAQSPGLFGWWIVAGITGVIVLLILLVIAQFFRLRLQPKARACVTVRTNIRPLIGGATEQTIIARVGEGIVSAIGSSQTYTAVAENLDGISKAVLGKGLDSGTAYEILSIDVADVDLGENIGGKLQVDRAEADTRCFPAEAEKRRAMAVAQATENKAKVEENRAKLVLAEAEVPKAIFGAFRSGNLGIVEG